MQGAHTDLSEKALTLLANSARDAQCGIVYADGSTQVNCKK